MQALVRHATLAPSSHNTQCWTFGLQATALGVRNAFVNQPVEVGSIRPRFASGLGLGGLRPGLVVRFGRGPAMPLSMRRPVEAVMV